MAIQVKTMEDVPSSKGDASTASRLGTRRTSAGNCVVILERLGGVEKKVKHKLTTARLNPHGELQCVFFSLPGLQVGAILKH